MIEVFYDGSRKKFKSFTFPGGEEHIRLEAGCRAEHRVHVKALVTNSSEFMKLILLIDVLRQNNKVPISLTLPYIPYARQDRVTSTLEPFSLKTFCRLLNSLHLESVEVWDAHSDVSLALIENVHNVLGVDIVRNIITKNDVIVAPDAGAAKRLYPLNYYNEVVQAKKHRDTKTGEITSTEVYCDGIGNKDFLIVDDICDGGATFISLAKALKGLNTGKIKLYVTHGIFSKGLDVFNGLIDEIYCANIWPGEFDNPILKKVTV